MDKKFISTINSEDISTTVYPDGVTENIYFNIEKIIPEYYTDDNIGTQISLSEYINNLTNRIISEYNTAEDFNNNILSDLDTKLTEVETYIQTKETEFKGDIETIKSRLVELQEKIDNKNTDANAYIETKISELEQYMNDAITKKKEEYGIIELENTITEYFTEKNEKISELENNNSNNTNDLQNLSVYIDKLTEEISGEYLINLFKIGC